MQQELDLTQRKTHLEGNLSKLNKIGVRQQYCTSHGRVFHEMSEAFSAIFISKSEFFFKTNHLKTAKKKNLIV